MKFKELQNKPTAELQKILEELRQKLQEMRFKVASKQLKNIREIREVKKNIAQILMILKNKQRSASQPKVEAATKESK